MTELQEMFICAALTYLRATKALLGPMDKVASVEELLKVVPDKVDLFLFKVKPLFLCQVSEEAK